MYKIFYHINFLLYLTKNSIKIYIKVSFIETWKKSKKDIDFQTFYRILGRFYNLDIFWTFAQEGKFLKDIVYLSFNFFISLDS